MKVILSYGRYYSYGKQYQAKFIYENIEEVKHIKSWIKTVNNKYAIQPVEELISLKKSKYNPTTTPINVVKEVNIPEDVLLSFISMLMMDNNASVIVGKNEFNNNSSIDDIVKEMNKLHINITLKKGKYFGLKDTYYVIFKYTSDEQREEVSYDFNMNLSPLIGNNIENECNIFPFITDRNGKITNENTGIIGGTNIPTQTLAFFLQRFINEYDAVITIEEKILEDDNEARIIHDAISKTNSGKRKIRTPRKEA